MEKGVSKKVVVLSYDFRGTTLHDRSGLEWKLARDGYSAKDSFLVICWSVKRETIHVSEHITIESLPAFAGIFRPLYDFLFIFVAPFFVWRHQWKPDAISIAELPLAWGAAMVRALFGGRMTVRLIGLPRDIAKTRTFVHYWYAVGNEWLAWRIPDHFATINEATREYALRLGVPAERISVSASDSIGIDAALIASTLRGEARKELGIPENVPIVLSVGRLEPEKAFDELIRTFVACSTDARLVILGEGILRPALEKLIRELGAEGKVILAGKKSRTDVWKYFKDADAFALVSLTEGIGLVFWEAITVGVPVIGRPVGGVKETIGEDGLRGFFWETSDGPIAFKAKLDRCFKKDGELLAMTKRAKQFVESQLANKSS